jgi:hypothetical protein
MTDDRALIAGAGPPSRAATAVPAHEGIPPTIVEQARGCGRPAFEEFRK